MSFFGKNSQKFPTDPTLRASSDNNFIPSWVWDLPKMTEVSFWYLSWGGTLIDLFPNTFTKKQLDIWKKKNKRGFAWCSCFLIKAPSSRGKFALNNTNFHYYFPFLGYLAWLHRHFFQSKLIDHRQFWYGQKWHRLRLNSWFHFALILFDPKPGGLKSKRAD